MVEIIMMIAVIAFAYFYLQQKQQIEDMQDKIETLEDTVIHQDESINTIGKIMLKGIKRYGNDRRTENDGKDTERSS
jgi:preprotein translocase subunit YajC